MPKNLSFKTLRDIGNITGKRVLLRLDLNVAIQNGTVTDGFRIQQSLETVEFLRKAGAKIVVVAHLENKEHPSLDIVCKYAQQFFPSVFVKDPWSTEGAGIIEGLANGQVAIIENIRNWAGEKNNDEAFAKQLAALGDIYVNEAFSVSHRAHASVVGVTKFLPSYAGFTFKREVQNLRKAFNPPLPYLFILGGAKFETKAPLIKKFLKLADNVFVGGALANDLFKAKGYEIGVSVCSDKDFGFTEMLSNPKLILPTDVVVETATELRVTKKPDQVLPGEKIWDAGEQAISNLLPLINNAGFILWNGPLGMFEKNYVEGTFALAKAIAAAGDTHNVQSIVGGGDTLASIEQLKLSDKFTFISTAGGAMLDFLANETLPGIEALKSSL
ncbi:TPA: phosphoglycerate kinase [Candidatus Taylorbacteria bacterium]|nr:phosphoglycerate kinase [Candidatus Taylorbacteria bacterium]